MGECGCGEVQLFETYKIAGYVLGIEYYVGCRYCHTGLMVSLHLYTKNEAESFDIETSKLKEFEPDKHGYSQLNFPVIGPEELRKAMKQMQEDGIDFSQYLDLDDVFADLGLQLLQEGNHILLEEIKERLWKIQ